MTMLKKKKGLKLTPLVKQTNIKITKRMLKNIKMNHFWKPPN